ncbi:MAG: hypothetical protein GEU87_12790 [Alphaproteobacteria bacterium]|nr:hypothetical protein [Alphaproteobacteria bacterium]
MDDEIRAAREKVRKSERNVETQRWRVNALEGNESAKWLAEQLLTGSEQTLRRHQEHLDELLDAESESGDQEDEQLTREHTEQRRGSLPKSADGDQAGPEATESTRRDR